MKNKKHIIIDLILLILFIVCLILSKNYYNQIVKENHLATINIKSSKITNKQVNEMILKEKDSEKPYDFVAWTESENIIVNNPKLERQEEVSTLEICGNSSLLVNGPILFREDKEGCLIDEETAYSLYGSKNVAGLSIMIDNKKYIVRGIHIGEKNLVVFQSKLTSKSLEGENLIEDNMLDYLSVNMKNERNKYIDNFCMKYGLNQNYIDNGVYASVAYFFMMLLPFVMIIYLVKEAIKVIIKNRNKLILCWLISICTILASIILLKIFGFGFKINYDLIPNKWSDFNYWSNLFETYSEKYRYIFYMKKSCMDKNIIGKAIRCILLSIINLHIFNWIKKDILIKSGRIVSE